MTQPAIYGSRTFQGPASGGGGGTAAGVFGTDDTITAGAPWTPTYLGFTSYSGADWSLSGGALVVPRDGWYMVRAGVRVSNPCSVLSQVLQCGIAPSGGPGGAGEGYVYCFGAWFNASHVQLFAAFAGSLLTVIYQTSGDNLSAQSPTLQAAWVAPLGPSGGGE